MSKKLAALKDIKKKVTVPAAAGLSDASKPREKRTQKFPLVKERREGTFGEFFVSLIRETKMKMKKLERKASPREKAALQNKISKLAAMVEKFTDPELLEVKKEYYRLEGRIEQITAGSERKSKESQDEFNKALKELDLERLAKILEAETEFAENVNNSDGEDEAVLDVSENAQVQRINEEFERKKGELNEILSEKILDQKVNDSSEIAGLKRQMATLRMERAEKVFNRIMNADKEFAVAIFELYQAMIAYPEMAKDTGVNAKDIEFIKSLSPIQKKEQEKLKLIPAKPRVEDEDFLQKAIRSLKPGMSQKQFDKLMYAPDEERPKHIRVRRARQGDDDDAEFSEEDVASDPEDAEEEEDAGSDAEEAEDAGELSTILMKSKAVGYLEDSEEEDEAEESKEDDSEDDEEPDKKEEHLPTVVKVEYRGIPLTRGEKLLLDIPSLQISEKRYKEVHSEIMLLRREIDYVYSLYRDLEQNVSEPFAQAAKISDSTALAIFQNNYNGKVITRETFTQSFDLTDEQKMLTKSLTENPARVQAVIDMIAEEPIPTLFDTRVLTSIPDKIGDMPEQQWVSLHYKKYLPYLARILGRAKVVLLIRGFEPKDMPLVLSREQDVLLREHLSRLSGRELDLYEDKVDKEKEYFLGLSIDEKIRTGIPVLPKISMALYSRYETIVEFLNKMVLSEVEKKTDYPFVTSFEAISEYIPSLLIRVLIRHRSQIADTRLAFLRKFLLSRLTVDQYVYVKVFMGYVDEKGNDTKEIFQKLVSTLRTAHLIATRVEKSGFKELDTILDPELKQIVLELVDYSTSLTIGNLFETKKGSILEYEKLFRALVPPGLLPKSEYTFLRDCRFAFRSANNLPFPVIGSLDDMKVVEKVYPRVLEQVGDWKNIKTILSESNKDLPDVNVDYQEDLVKALVDAYFRNLVKKEMDEISLFITQKKGRAVGADENAEVSKRLSDIDQMLQKRLGESRTLPHFQSIDQYFGAELAHFILYASKMGYEIALSEYLQDILPREDEKAEKSALIIMKEKMEKTAVRLSRIARSMLPSSDPNISDPVAEKKRISAPRDPTRPILKQSQNLLKVFEQTLKKDAIDKADAEFLVSAPLRYTMSLLNEDSLNAKLKDVEEYLEEYEMLYSQLDQAKRKKKGKIADLMGKQKELMEGELSSIRKMHTELFSPSINYVKAEYIMADQSKKAYEWADRGVLRVHPELMRMMPLFAVQPTATPFEFCGMPLSPSIAGWVHPSVLFFHTLANADVQVNPDGLLVDGRPVSLGMIQGGGIVQASASDYEKLLAIADLKSVMDAFHHSELVVIPSQIDRQMVFPIESDALFYPGYETVIKKVSSQEELTQRLEKLLLLKARLPEQHEKIDLRIKQLQEEIAIEPRVGALDRLEQAYRVKLMSTESLLEEMLAQANQLEQERDDAELVGEETKEQEEQISMAKKKMAPILDKISRIRKEYIKELKASKIEEPDVQKRIEQVQLELRDAPLDLAVLQKRIEETSRVLNSMMKEPRDSVRLGVEEAKLSELREMASRWAVVRKDKLRLVEGQLAELHKVQDIQKERFVRRHEIRQLELRRELLSQGWLRPTIHLVREMNRVGRVGDKGSVRVGSIDYSCALIRNGKLVPFSGEAVLGELRQYVGKRTAERYALLDSFIPRQPQQDESDEKYQGTRDAACANCKKSMKRVWRNTVQLVDGEPRVVPLCSEKCSEEYRPSK